MKAKQAITIIGASGEAGSAIAKRISKGNFRILLHAADPSEAGILADHIKAGNAFADIETVDNLFEACWEADIIIMAVPYDSKKWAACNIREVVNQKIVVSVSSPLSKAINEHAIKKISAAEELQMLLPNAKVIGAFIAVSANGFEPPVINEQKPGCYITGNDEDALDLVYDLVKTWGFHPVIAGDLSMSRTIEDMQVAAGTGNPKELQAGRMEGFI